MRHPRKKLTPAELRAGRAGLGLGAAATQAALLYGAYRGGKALYNHFRPEEEGGEEAPVKEAGWGTTAASGVAGAAVGVPMGAVLGALEPVQTWRDIYAGSGAAGLVPQDVHPDVRPGMSQGLRAGLGLGAAATQAALLYGAYRGGKALYNHFRPEEEGGEEAPVKEAGAWDTVKQFAKGHTATNSPWAAGLHAGLAKGTMGGALTGGYTALKGREEGEGWGDLARRSAVSGVKGAVGGAITTGIGAGAMQHFVNKAHAPGAAATGWMAQARHLHPQAASGPQTFAHMQQAASPKEYMQRMVDVSKGNYPGGASKESPYAFPMT